MLSVRVGSEMGIRDSIQFDAPATCPAEVERRVRILDNVIRYLCVRKDA